MCYNTYMTTPKHWPTRSIRVNPEAMHLAKVAAAMGRKTLGRWLGEAIEEKVQREKENADAN